MCSDAAAPTPWSPSTRQLTIRRLATDMGKRQRTGVAGVATANRNGAWPLTCAVGADSRCSDFKTRRRAHLHADILDMLDSAPASVRVSSRLSAAVGSPARSRRLSPLTPTSANSSAENASAASAASQPLPAVAPPSPSATAAAASTAAAPTPPRSPTNLAAQQSVPPSFWAAVFRKSDAEAAEPESRFSFSERVADWVSENIGSWTFILILLVFLIAWFVLNLVLEPAQQWDQFPFILVNLLLSFIAAYAHLICNCFLLDFAHFFQPNNI